MRIYATYKSMKDIRPDLQKEGKYGKLQLVWGDIRDDAGNPIIGEVYSNPAKIFKRARFGNRYVIDFKRMSGNRIIHPTNINVTNKNLRCDVARKLNGDYVFIRGKFKGKTFSKIAKHKIMPYLLWLAKTTKNEATVINALDMLRQLSDEK